MTLLNRNVAFDSFLEVLKFKGFRVKMRKDREGLGGHIVVEAENIITKDYHYFYIVFKREKAHEFNSFFPAFVERFPDLAGWGESLNVECVEYARKREATIVFIYEDGSMYSILATAMYNICVRSGLRRVQERTNDKRKLNGYGASEVIREETYTIPLKLLERFN